jgi:hypothetical protein
MKAYNVYDFLSGKIGICFRSFRGTNEPKKTLTLYEWQKRKERKGK